ncbi:MAG: cytochrome C assembly protein, partial [Armatimonadetes bacterium]|nr:cytochrome C assembly protein [Armatimonadota bacterium]
MTEPGRIAVLVGLVASVAAFALYLRAGRGGRRPGAPPATRLARLSLLTSLRSPLAWARLANRLAAAASVFCFGWLMYLVASKRFEYRYVFDYTSADLEGAFLYSATWAGQEGSFALWAALTGLIGVLVAWRARDWESRVMPVYLTSMIALFAIMHWLSPYVVMPPETGARPPDLPPGAVWPPPWPPLDGNGLNPSLQNIWMAIHPPTIFFGFASLAVPFAYAIATLIWRSYDRWTRHVAPYVLLTVATLGAGLFMGGYWAYETQGWHGFWAWDPVENASLFPWLGALALAHGLVVQRTRGGMIGTNLFLAIASWLLFVYGTFLTRSGVLADFSVHAFGMLDNAALKILVALIAVQGLVGIGLLVLRRRDLRAPKPSDRSD